jgi:hypothetical protein
MPVRVLTCRRLLGGFPIVVGSIVEVIVDDHDNYRKRAREIDGGGTVEFIKGCSGM